MMQHKAEPMCRAGGRFVISRPQPTTDQDPDRAEALVRPHWRQPSRWRRTDQRSRDQRIGKDLSSGSPKLMMRYLPLGGKDDVGR
jgi:hypothetical protein